VASPRYCEGATQNSHKRLLQLVGPRGEPAPTHVSGADLVAPIGGCQMGGPHRASGPASGAFAAIFAVFALRACRRRRGRL
jgi:hypothetical protein